MTNQRVAAEILRDWLEATNTTQTAVAEALDVTRVAVSKWCSGDMAPSVWRAKALERYTAGAVPAARWPRREMPEPATRGAELLQKAADKMGLSVSALSRHTGIPTRALHRWIVGQHAPRKPGIAMLNATLRLKLTERDFEVRA